MANEQPYDPYIPSGRGTPGPNAQHGDNDRTAALQAVRNTSAIGSPDIALIRGANDRLRQQIDDTVNVMRQNIQRTEQRQGNIDQLGDATHRLQGSAHDFQRGTNRVRKQFWWKNLRMMGWIGLGAAIIVAILIALSLSTPGFDTVLAQLTSLQ